MPPTVKSSSMGSISSVASTLSAHPAIKRLPMNDFTDDSAVKFYLNRRRGRGDEFEDQDEEMMMMMGFCRGQKGGLPSRTRPSMPTSLLRSMMSLALRVSSLFDSGQRVPSLAATSQGLRRRSASTVASRIMAMKQTVIPMVRLLPICAVWSLTSSLQTIFLWDLRRARQSPRDLL